MYSPKPSGSVHQGTACSLTCVRLPLESKTHSREMISNPACLFTLMRAYLNLIFCPLQFVYVEAKHSHAKKESILFLSGGEGFSF